MKFILWAFIPSDTGTGNYRIIKLLAELPPYRQKVYSDFEKRLKKIVKSECEEDDEYDLTEKVLSRASFFLEESFFKKPWKRSV